MKDEEFVKLKHWIDAEFTMLHVYLALIIGFVADNRIVWIGVIVYIILSLLYAATRLSYVESKHSGYLKIPRI